jgi:DNA polymerase-1
MAESARAKIDMHQPNADRWNLSRKDAKTTIFGLIYGQTAVGLAGRLGVSKAEAETILNGVFESMPALRDLKEWVIEQLHTERPIVWTDIHTNEDVKDGFLYTLLGHRVYYPDIFKKGREKWAAARAERQAGNALIQGSAAGINKFLHLQVFRLLQELGYGRTAVAVHDENWVYLPIDKATPEVLQCLNEQVNSDELLVDGDVVVPVSAEYNYGFDTKEAKDGNYCNISNKERYLEWQTYLHSI